MRRLGSLVNQLHHIVDEVGVVPGRLLVQLLHLLANFLLLLFVVFHLFLALAEDLIDLGAAFFCSFDLVWLIFFNCFRNGAGCVGYTLYCALDEACNAADRLSCNTDQAATNSFEDASGAILHAALDRLRENASDSIEHALNNREASVPQASHYVRGVLCLLVFPFRRGQNVRHRVNSHYDLAEAIDLRLID